jgi:hypothetical protein
MPSFENLARGQQTNQTTGELLALKWMDKREVHMLNTVHKPIMVETEKNDRGTDRKIKKPLCIVQYNKNMRSRHGKQFLRMSTENSNGTRNCFSIYLISLCKTLMPCSR